MKRASRDGRQMPARSARGGLRRLGTGFTIVEILVVVLIIAVMATLIVPRFFGRIGGAKQAVAQQKVAVLETKVLEFQADCGRLPTAQEGLQALLRPPADVSENWKGPYVPKEKDILDPWGVELLYRYPGRYNDDFDIFTYGADGQEGGDGENEDIGNW